MNICRFNLISNWLGLSSKPRENKYFKWNVALNFKLSISFVRDLEACES